MNHFGHVWRGFDSLRFFEVGQGALAVACYCVVIAYFEKGAAVVGLGCEHALPVGYGFVEASLHGVGFGDDCHRLGVARHSGEHAGGVAFHGHGSRR